MNFIGGFTFLFAGALATIPSRAAPAPDATDVADVPLVATLTIDATKEIGPVNRLAFGQNIEAADSAGIFGMTTQKDKILYGEGFWDPKIDDFAPAVLKKAKALDVTILRYPGGSLVNNFDWRKAVGPRATRGEWQFGLEEYLALCGKLGAEPLIQVSDYVLPADQMPSFAADLVEYLNAPAIPKYPWAMKRAAWGHPEPHRVKFFELGNESDNGNFNVKPSRLYSPQQYAAYANACMAAMRAIDPAIKIGILSQTSTGRKDYDNAWNRIVLSLAGKNADFIVIHDYLVGGAYVSGDSAAIILGSLGTSEITAHRLKETHDFITAETGRDLPVAVTEYNGSFRDEKPIPYRFTFAQAMVAADSVRLYLDPRNNVGMANYWQMFDGYFGSLRISEIPGNFTTKELAAYYLYRLWAQHFGATLIDFHLDSPKVESDGAAKSLVFTGDTYVPSRTLATVSLVGKLTTENIPDTQKIHAEITPDGTMRVDLNDFTGTAYPVIGSVQNPAGVPEGTDYRITCQVRFIPKNNSQANGLGLGLCDSRGWAATQRAISIPGIDNSEWTVLSDSIYGLPDTTGMDLVARIEPRSGSISGMLEIRDASMEIRSKPVYPAYDRVTASCSLSADRGKLYVILFNKSTTGPVVTTINLGGFPATAGARWEVASPSYLSIDGIHETMTDVPISIGQNQKTKTVTLSLPSRSMSALEFIK